MKNYITFDFDKLKIKKNVKRIYNAEIWQWFNKNKDCVFTVITEHDSSHMLHRHIETFFVKNTLTLKNGYIDRAKGILYVETYNNRLRSITEKYIVVNKRLRLD